VGSESAASSSASAAPASPYAGSWTGSFKAEKGAVEVPKGVTYKAWEDDDGKALSGAGEVILTIGDDGEVKGTASGALGKLDIRGRLEDDALRAGVVPADPQAEDAVAGVLTGELKGKDIIAHLRVANGDASLVRQAKLTLAKK
jgi:hypothetical protein